MPSSISISFLPYFPLFHLTIFPRFSLSFYSSFDFSVPFPSFSAQIRSLSLVYLFYLLFYFTKRQNSLFFFSTYLSTHHITILVTVSLLPILSVLNGFFIFYFTLPDSPITGLSLSLFPPSFKIFTPFHFRLPVLVVVSLFSLFVFFSFSFYFPLRFLPPCLGLTLPLPCHLPSLAPSHIPPLPFLPFSPTASFPLSLLAPFPPLPRDTDLHPAWGCSARGRHLNMKKGSSVVAPRRCRTNTHIRPPDRHHHISIKPRTCGFP